MPITLELREGVDLAIEVGSLPFDQLAVASAKEVASVRLWYGNRSVEMGEVFAVSGTPEEGRLVFQGDCRNVKGIGAKLQSGRILVEGNAGPHLGAEMTGGGIEVTGDVGDWAGAEMRGGRIQIRGSAGDQVGGAYRGSKKGMRGGEILIYRNTGIELGARQRRGLIAVAGHAGAGCGYAMIAGTILIGGHMEAACGIGMKRGSIILLESGSTGSVPLTFRRSLTSELAFLMLYFRHLEKLGFPIDVSLAKARYQISRGDFVHRGLGEILCRV